MDDDRIRDVGAVRGERTFRLRDPESSRHALDRLGEFGRGARFVVGHNVVAHDRRFIEVHRPDAELLGLPLVDTLYLAPLAFPQRPYHSLVKDYKLAGERSDPVEDCRVALRVLGDCWRVLGKRERERRGLVSIYRSCFDDADVPGGTSPLRLNGTGQVLEMLGAQRTPRERVLRGFEHFASDRAWGSFVQTLVVTDIATGWTEGAPVLYREQTLLREVLGEVRRLMPFDLLGFDTDNDSVFINETLRDYCRDAGIVFTRCRPWRKNDQAFVEQKNGAVVRRIRRLPPPGGPGGRYGAVPAYATTRLCVNFFFQASFKLASKRRDGARSQQALSRTGDPEPAAAGDPEDACRRVRTRRRTVDVARSDPAASADAGASAARRGHRQPAGCGTGGQGGPAARAVPRRPADRLRGRRSDDSCCQGAPSRSFGIRAVLGARGCEIGPSGPLAVAGRCRSRADRFAPHCGR